ncbi:DUF2946 domain-containing protein [Pseudomonas helleri]|uniref:DUF2946 domain-containing protein n=1 Tax=Pseudomonas helleri TaxID=1608996 RepID=A0A7X2C223_9PSED|nr:DUF2946 domain-containing protein [Pseudomonas helleri]MQT88025.1 DUF2946 domain-containing protein [Pseudomonas helleri]
MNTPRIRQFVAWALYACVLFNLLSCGFAHGQMSAQSLHGLNGQFCSLSHHGSPAPMKDLAGNHDSLKSDQAPCPICSGAIVVLLALFALAWPRIRPVLLTGLDQRCKPPSRYSWPSANPRASPPVFQV